MGNMVYLMAPFLGLLLGPAFFVILLYVLRNCGNEITEQDISKGTGVNVIDIPEVLDYWVSLDICTKSNRVYTPSTKSFENK